MSVEMVKMVVESSMSIRIVDLAFAWVVHPLAFGAECVGVCWNLYAVTASDPARRFVSLYFAVLAFERTTGSR